MNAQARLFTLLLYYHNFLLNIFGLWRPPATNNNRAFAFVHSAYAVSLISSICIYSLYNAYIMFATSVRLQQPLPTTNIFTSHQIILYAVLVMLLFISQLGYAKQHSHLLDVVARRLFLGIWKRFPANNDRISVNWFLMQFCVGSIVVNVLKIVITTSNTVHTDHADQQQTNVLIHLILTNCMYMIISTFENHFYAVLMLFVFQYKVVNQRIDAIANEAASIVHQRTIIATNKQRKRLDYESMATYCRLSDELNEMADMHDRITSLTHRFTHLYRFQIVLLVTWKFYLFISQTYQEYLVVTSFISEQRSGYQQLFERLVLWMLNFVGIYLISHFSSQIQNEVRNHML